jgi:bacillithiol system protein YtxJ
MLKIGLVFSFSLLILAGALADDADPGQDAPGTARHDENGIPQMWGGPKLTEIKTMEELDKALKESEESRVFIFKHSTACPISARAAARVSKYAEEGKGEKPEIYWLKVIEARPVSKELASRVSVKHKSPQMILLDKGKAVWDTSHADITAETMDEAIAEKE